MPDISRLQREYETVQEESKTPGVVFTVALILLIVSVGAYIGLYAYESVLQKRIDDAVKITSQLKVGDAYKNVAQLTAISRKVTMLKSLRESHTNLRELLLNLEQTTHPLAYFESGKLDAENVSADLRRGTLPTAAMLVRQMDIYKANKTIENFTIDNIGYGEKHYLRFDVTLHFRQ